MYINVVYKLRDSSHVGGEAIMRTIVMCYYEEFCLSSIFIPCLNVFQQLLELATV